MLARGDHSESWRMISEKVEAASEWAGYAFANWQRMQIDLIEVCRRQMAAAMVFGMPFAGGRPGADIWQAMLTTGFATPLALTATTSRGLSKAMRPFRSRSVRNARRLSRPEG